MCDLSHHHSDFGFIVDVPEIRALIDETPRLRAQRSPERADHARGDGMLKAIRVADRDRDLPDAHAPRIAETRPWQCGVNSQHREVGACVLTHDIRA